MGMFESRNPREFARLKNDYLAEGEISSWTLKNGTRVEIVGDVETDGNVYIDYIDAVFKIDPSELEVEQINQEKEVFYE